MGRMIVSGRTLLLSGFVFLILSQSNVSGQAIEAEVAGMGRYTSLTGSFFTPLTKNQKWSFMLASRYYINYGEDDLAAVFSNIGYSFAPKMAATAGVMYFGESPTPMAGLQMRFGEKAVTGMFAPSLTFGEDLSVMMISQVQYVKPVTEKTEAVSRLMLLGFVGFNGDIFSRLSFRGGLKTGRFGYGIAADGDMLIFEETEAYATVGAYVQCSLSVRKRNSQGSSE